MKILIIANCQGRSIQTCLAVGRGDQVELFEAHKNADGLTRRFLNRFDAIIIQNRRYAQSDLSQLLKAHPRVINFPWLLFYGLTPDHCVLSPVAEITGKNTEKNTKNPPENQSRRIGNIPRIMAAAHTRGLTRGQTRALYNPEFIEAMGYHSDFAVNRSVLIESLSAYTPRAEALFERWFNRGVFFYTGNHPNLMVIEDILREVLKPHDMALPSVELATILPDPLEIPSLVPNLNHPAATNLLNRQDHVYKFKGRVIGLKTMVARAFRVLDERPDMQVDPLGMARFDQAYAAWTDHKPGASSNPYSGRPDHTFWSKAVARPKADDVAPGADLMPLITPQTRVATAGSCFAQHVARAMVQDGLTYHVTEPAPEGMDPDLAQQRGYGLFSARFGNIYSTRALLQLIQRAYGRFTPIETAWKVKDGYIDPLRPNIGEVFGNPEAVETARAAHLAKVREMFETLDVFVFTLGLTEGWYDRRDGTAFPVVPGAVTKAANPDHFEFQNHDYTQVRADLAAFLGELAAVNPDAKVILTVSPVPLIATYGDGDVLSATTYSKSVLRAVAGDVAAGFEAVQYFPSYEIITGGFNRGAYFEDDLRSVRPSGVAHVMGVFRQRLVVGVQLKTGEGQPEAAAQRQLEQEQAEQQRAKLADEMGREMDLICDEELLVR